MMVHREHSRSSLLIGIIVLLCAGVAAGRWVRETLTGGTPIASLLPDWASFPTSEIDTLLRKTEGAKDGDWAEIDGCSPSGARQYAAAYGRH